MPDVRDREFLLASRFEDYVRHHAQVHDLESRMREAAKEAEDYRVERLNDLRSDLEKDRTQYVTSAAADLHFGNIEERMRKVEQAQSGQHGSSTAWIAAIAVFFTIVQIALRLVLE